MEGLEGQTRMHAPTFECIPGRYRRPNTHSYERPSGYNQNVSRSEYMPRRAGRRNISSREWYNRPHVFRSSSLGFPVNQAYYKKKKDFLKDYKRVPKPSSYFN